MSSIASSTFSIAPQPSKLFGCEVVGTIGEGAGSQIYVVVDPATNKRMALKHVICKKDKDVRFADQMINEFKVASAIKHAGVRRVIDLKVERTLFRKIKSAMMLMELFNGEPLDQMLPRDDGSMIDMFVAVAQALGAMHAAGYIHCDLKPSNILRNSSGEIRVIDLGQACKIGEKKERIQGTPDYISPEQVKLQPLDERTDVFNLGATMYWCLCGQKLPTLFTVGNKGDNSFLVDQFIKAPHEHNSKVPESLSNFVMECCRTSRDRRPRDMKAVIQRLETIRHGIKARSPSV